MFLVQIYVGFEFQRQDEASSVGNKSSAKRKALSQIFKSFAIRNYTAQRKIMVAASSS